MYFLVSFTFEFVAEYDAHHDTDNTHYQTAKQGRPEPIHHERNAKRLTDRTGQHQHDGINDEGEQAQSKNNKWAGEELEQRTHKRIQ